ncbi:MAG: enhanced serine sensitivity protein SseB [Peptococcaceae bacterium]|jgi:hypothetical protein|nr:enhanced serine sensitivity protein SseB [Peptococcaceae bacterium]
MADIDINRPITNPSLVDAMDKLQRNVTLDTESSFIKTLREARLLAPVVITPSLEDIDKDGKIVLKEDTSISFQSIKNEKGERFFLVFTDWDAIFHWRKEPDQQTLIVTFDDLNSLSANSRESIQGFVLNPGSHNVIIRKENLRAINEQPPAGEVAVGAGTKVLLGEPKKYPREMIGAISDYLKTQPAVKQAFFMLMMRNEQQSFLVVVDWLAAPADKKAVYDGIGQAALPHLRQGQYLDLVAADEELGKSAVENWQPFYTVAD